MGGIGVFSFTRVTFIWDVFCKHDSARPYICKQLTKAWGYFPPVRPHFSYLWVTFRFSSLTLTMLRLLPSKAQGCNVFWKPFTGKPCHVGILWIALAEYTLTWVPMCQGFDHLTFLHHFVVAKLATNSSRVKVLKIRVKSSKRPNSHFHICPFRLLVGVHTHEKDRATYTHIHYTYTSMHNFLQQSRKVPSDLELGSSFSRVNFIYLTSEFWPLLWNNILLSLLFCFHLNNSLRRIISLHPPSNICPLTYHLNTIYFKLEKESCFNTYTMLVLSIR